MKNRKSKEKEKIWIKYWCHSLNTKFGQSLKRSKELSFSAKGNFFSDFLCVTGSHLISTQITLQNRHKNVVPKKKDNYKIIPFC